MESPAIKYIFSDVNVGSVVIDCSDIVQAGVAVMEYPSAQFFTSKGVIDDRYPRVGRLYVNDDLVWVIHGVHYAV